MEVRKDFAARLECLCRAVPVQAVESLLLGLLPRIPVQCRAPKDPLAKREEYESEYEAYMAAPVINGSDPLAKLTKGRRVRARPRGNASYTVLHATAYRNHRKGTWRHAMVQCAVTNPNVADALRCLRTAYPRFADKGIDFAWCAAQGYIKL